MTGATEIRVLELSVALPANASEEGKEEVMARIEAACKTVVASAVRVAMTEHAMERTRAERAARKS